MVDLLLPAADDAAADADADDADAAAAADADTAAAADAAANKIKVKVEIIFQNLTSRYFKRPGHLATGRQAGPTVRLFRGLRSQVQPHLCGHRSHHVAAQRLRFTRHLLYP